MGRPLRRIRLAVTRALPAVAASLQPLGLGAQEDTLSDAVRARIAPERLAAHAREIARHVRPSGSPGENAAIDYIVGELRTGGVPVEVHELMAYASDPVAANVSVPGTSFDPDAITMSFSGSTEGVEGVAVDLGGLADLPGLEVGTGERLVARDVDRFAHVRGKVAVVTGQPRNIPTTVLQQLGAIAAIYVNPEERLNELIVTSTWGTPSLLSAHRLNTLPTAQIRRSAGDRLRAMMADGEVTVRVATEVVTGWKPLRLPVARIMPTDDDSAPYVLFGGHIDGWHHGATDEAASNASMLELALAFHENRALLRRGLVVAWWPGHSNARYGGSTWFADHFFDELLDRGTAYVNIDGVGQKGAVRFGASTSPALRQVAFDAVRAEFGAEVLLGRPGRNSDQAFNGAGMPLLQINHTRLAEDGGYWWWHTPEDTYDKIDPDVLALDTRVYADALSALLASPTYPVDLVAEADALVEALETRHRESEGALDLTEPIRRAHELARVLGDVAAQQRRAPPSSALDLAAVAVVRPLHRVMFVPGSDHHPDPGIYGRPLPGMEPVRLLAEEDRVADRFRFAEAQLIRERNRVLEAITEAMHRARDLSELVRRVGT